MSGTKRKKPKALAELDEGELEQAAGGLLWMPAIILTARFAPMVAHRVWTAGMLGGAPLAQRVASVAPGSPGYSGLGRLDEVVGRASDPIIERAVDGAFDGLEAISNRGTR